MADVAGERRARAPGLGCTNRFENETIARSRGAGIGGALARCLRPLRRRRPLGGKAATRWTPFCPSSSRGPRGPLVDGASCCSERGALSLPASRAAPALRRGPRGYSTTVGAESYIAFPPESHGGCSFGSQAIYALEPAKHSVIPGYKGRSRLDLSPRCAGSSRVIAFDEVGTTAFAF